MFISPAPEIKAQLMNRVLIPLLHATLIFSTNSSRAEAAEPMYEFIREMQETVAGQQLRYLLQVPTGDPPAEGWPVLLFLHGYGECGDNIAKVKVHGPPKLTDEFELLANCVIVSPQCPKDSWWRVDALKALMDEVIAGRSDIDSQRRYVTGLSMGGYGIWSFLSEYPDYFAAAVPICGGGDPFHLPKNHPPEKTGIDNEFDPEGLKLAKQVPIWTFHGTEDHAVPILETERLVELLQKAGSNTIRFTRYEGAGHIAAWENAYENPDVWKWLFAQRLASDD
jgi:predicted peptidase